jgi:hypothetical protein
MNTQPSQPTAPAVDRAPFFALRLTILVVTAAGCLVASAFHAGLTLPIGSVTLAEHPIAPAAVVEGVIGLLLAASAVAQATGQRWARQLTLNAYLIGIAGFILGIAIVVRTPEIQTPFNVGVHLGIFPLLIAGLLLELAAWRGERRATGA